MAVNQDQDICELGAYLADIPMQTDTVPRRWWQSINIMLEKVAGLNQVDKICIIHLFNADFNANNKWLGQAIMTQAKSKQLLADKQYGSQKQQLAIVQCLNKCLCYDLICGTQISAALCSNDTQSCYNQIILLIAALCMCQFGAGSF